MDQEAVVASARRVLNELDNLVGNRSASMKARLASLLKEAYRGRNVTARLLEFLFSEEPVREWVIRDMDAHKPPFPESERSSVHYSGPDEEGDEELDPVRFSAFYPEHVARDSWSDLLAYVFAPAAADEVRSDSRKRLDNPNGFREDQADASGAIQRGAEITVVPELPHCRINPPRASLLWLEDWHRAEFRVQVKPDATDVQLKVPAIGKISFFVGPLAVAEIPIWAKLGDASPAAQEPKESPEVGLYRKVFCSYSHKDRNMAEEIERAHRVLGDDFWRDVQKLRSGEEWSPALEENIEDSDIFQLFWSENSAGSNYCRDEWSYALSLGRPGFLRPFYWQDSMPSPPPELNHLHFARY